MDAPTRALTRSVVETERHVAGSGWDQPPRLFALVRTAALLAEEPGLAATLDPTSVAEAAEDPQHLTAVEQEGMLTTATVEELLGRIAWPDGVHGVTLSLERVVVPPEVEREMPADEDAAVDWLAAHPQRQDVRLVVGVLREGQRMCAIRQRSNDEDTSVGVGEDLVPGLTAALLATFDD